MRGVRDARLQRSPGALINAARAKADTKGVDAVGVDGKHVARGRFTIALHGAASGTQSGLHVSEGRERMIHLRKDGLDLPNAPSARVA